MNSNFKHLKFSKNKVKESVKKLIVNGLEPEDRRKNVAILANFRSSHSYPMQSMIVNFTKKALSVDKKAIVVRRLKRIPSILSKLRRISSMKVSTMGDIGGIRIITENLKNVETIKNSIKRSRTRNKLISEKDYVQDPKNSGYRGVHLTYSYQGSKSLYNGLRVELQIRSKIQHSWATAVEVVSAFLEENLKASEGDDKWLSFFQEASLGFAYLEQNEPIELDLKKKLQQKVRDLAVFDALKSFSVVVKHSGQKQGFYLVSLDLDEKTVSVQFFKNSFLPEALEEYRRIEQDVSEDTQKDVVLVSSKSLSSLKKAYPNYFADTNFFLTTLQNILE